MRKLKLDSYDPSTRDDLGQVSAVSRAWVLLWVGTANFPSGNVEQTARGMAVYKALRSVSEPTPDVKDSRRLKPSGASLLLEEGEFKLLQDVVTKMREQIPIANADALVYLDDAFKNAQIVTAEDLQKESEQVAAS